MISKARSSLQSNYGRESLFNIGLDHTALNKSNELTGMAKFIQKFTHITYSLYLTYMVFFFYSILPILLYRSNLDIVALFVFILVMVTLPI